jgi:hypothetical protein
VSTTLLRHDVQGYRPALIENLASQDGKRCWLFPSPMARSA